MEGKDMTVLLKFIVYFSPLWGGFLLALANFLKK